QGTLNGTLLSRNAYTAQVNWGDSNQWQAADVAPGFAGEPFLVKGSHVYAAAGTYRVVVYVQGPDSTSASTEATTVTVSDLPTGNPGPTLKAFKPPQPPGNVTVELGLGSSALSSFAGVGLQENVLATVSGMISGQSDLTPTDYKAQINWGDSNQWFDADLAP